MSASEEILVYNFENNRPLLNDGGADILGYNLELDLLGSPKWFNVPWLYAECYLCAF